MTLLDEEILPKEMQMLKVFLPFLPSDMQKMFAIYLKWQELQYTISYFSRHQITQKNPDISNLLSCLKGILPREQQDQFEQIADLFENMDMYREMFEGFSSAFVPGQEGDDL